MDLVDVHCAKNASGSTLPTGNIVVEREVGEVTCRHRDCAFCPKTAYQVPIMPTIFAALAPTGQIARGKFKRIQQLSCP